MTAYHGNIGKVLNHIMLEDYFKQFLKKTLQRDIGQDYDTPNAFHILSSPSAGYIKFHFDCTMSSAITQTIVILRLVV